LSLEVRFGDHPVDFMVALSTGGFSRTLVDLIDFLVDFSVDFSVDVSVRVSVDYLPVGFWLVVGLYCKDTAITPFSKFVAPPTTYTQIGCGLPSWLSRPLVVLFGTYLC
jgi:hypothetical protein